MATFTWNAYYGAGPSWQSVSTNTLVFCGSPTDISTPITLGSWNGGCHIGNGDPGTDQCSTNHVPWVKYVTDTQFDNGSGTQTLNTTNFAQTDCQLQILFTDASSVSITNARVYIFNSTTTTSEATGIEAYGFERVTGLSTWVNINDDSGNIGGDNSGERIDCTDQGAATSHTYYIGMTARPETVGAKGDFDIGMALTYS